jgi:hypothetical protein
MTKIQALYIERSGIGEYDNPCSGSLACRDPVIVIDVPRVPAMTVRVSIGRSYNLAPSFPDQPQARLLFIYNHESNYS